MRSGYADIERAGSSTSRNEHTRVPMEAVGRLFGLDRPGPQERVPRVDRSTEEHARCEPKCIGCDSGTTRQRGPPPGLAKCCNKKR